MKRLFPSIRSRVTATLMACLAVLLTAGAASVYFIAEAVFTRDFDNTIRNASKETLESITLALVRKTEHKVEFPSPVRSHVIIGYEVWASAGECLGRTEGLEGVRLVDDPAAPLERERWRNLSLPDGRRIRVLIFAFPSMVSHVDERQISHISRKSGVEHESDEERQMKAKLAALPKQMLIAVAADMAGLDKVLNRLALVAAGVAVASLLVMAMLVTQIIRRGFGPLESLAEQVRNVDASRLSARFDCTNAPRELAPISERLNDLLARLETAFSRERQFTADLSHELRTPIAELRSLAEVTLRQGDLPPATRETFEDVLASSLQMQGIVTSLLAITRCEAGTQGLNREHVALADLVSEQWAPHARQAGLRKLAVQWKTDALPQAVTDRALLGSILTNLFSNAVEYTPTGGAITIEGSALDSGFELLVTNDAPELTGEDVTHLFDRFWRKDVVRSSSHHAGIGLSLARALARHLDLSLEARLSASRQLTMVLRSRS